MRIKLWRELDDREHSMFMIEALGMTVGFYDMNDFCFELNHLYKDGDWLDD